MRPALRAKVDCSLAEVGERKDGDWVTVGGMISECKRIRTKKGDPMMFATLDDLEGQVEVLIFNSAYAKNKGQVEVEPSAPRSRSRRPRYAGSNSTEFAR